MYIPQISLGIGVLILSIEGPQFFWIHFAVSAGCRPRVVGQGVVPSDVCAGEDLQILIRLGEKGILKQYVGKNPQSFILVTLEFSICLDAHEIPHPYFFLF